MTTSNVPVLATALKSGDEAQDADLLVWKMGGLDLVVTDQPKKLQRSHKITPTRRVERSSTSDNAYANNGSQIASIKPANRNSMSFYEDFAREMGMPMKRNPAINLISTSEQEKIDEAEEIWQGHITARMLPDTMEAQMKAERAEQRIGRVATSSSTHKFYKKKPHMGYDAPKVEWENNVNVFPRRIKTRFAKPTVLTPTVRARHL
jgi:hypothetical protein